MIPQLEVLIEQLQDDYHRWSKRLTLEADGMSDVSAATIKRVQARQLEICACDLANLLVFDEARHVA